MRNKTGFKKIRLCVIIPLQLLTHTKQYYILFIHTCKYNKNAKKVHDNAGQSLPLRKVEEKTMEEHQALAVALKFLFFFFKEHQSFEVKRAQC